MAVVGMILRESTLRPTQSRKEANIPTAAGLNITEPSSTGIGGDMFLLYYDAATRKVSAMNGSGRAGSNCTLERIRVDLGFKEGEAGKIPMSSVHAVTVPGAAAGWVDAVERFGSGKVGLEEVLRPAIELGEGGFPVSELTAVYVSFFFFQSFLFFDFTRAQRQGAVTHCD
jgi:gamma-glutamyltranspeptidase / glutathione hydrolase